MVTLVGIDEATVTELGTRACDDALPENGPNVFKRFREIEGRVVKARVLAMFERAARARVKGRTA